MSPQRTEPAPRAGAKATAIIALAAALLGGGGGVALTPRTTGTDSVSKADVNDALAQINTKLEHIESAITELRAEAAVSRYEREHRRTP
jgi:hypothetical protein